MVLFESIDVDKFMNVDKFTVTNILAFGVDEMDVDEFMDVA